MVFGIKKSEILLTTSVLLIIWGLILAVRTIFLIEEMWGSPPPLCCPACAPMRTRDVALISGIAETLWPFLIVLFLLGVVTTLVAGIMGVANWKKPQNANHCFICGIIALVAYLCFFWVWGIVSIVRVGFFVVYILYTAGAMVLKRYSHTPN